MRNLNIIVAVDSQGGFGKDGRIPWHYAEDFKHFQRTTEGSTCIMGRKTYVEILMHAKKRWLSARKKHNPENLPDIIPLPEDLLPNRQCIVVSRTIRAEGNALTVNSLSEAVSVAEPGNPIFVIGGQKLFWAALPRTTKVHLTVVKKSYGCDRFFPVNYLNRHFKIVAGSQNEDMYFVQYERK